MIHEMLHAHLSYLAVAASGGDGGSEWITRACMGIATIVGAFTAFKVARKDSNATDLKDAVADLRNAKIRIDDLEKDVLDLRNYSFALREILADKGIASPAAPVMRSGRS